MTATQRESGIARRLLGLGVDKDLAERLATDGQTQTKLRALTTRVLHELGLTDAQVEWIKDTSRPPIPAATVARVLTDAAWTCCICKDRSRSVILHHIQEWALSHDHEPSNLAVLCLQHHDEAHTKRGLTLSLTASRLRQAKAQWEAEVSQRASQAFIATVTAADALWDYINVPRLFQLARQQGVPFNQLPSFGPLLQNNLVLSNGDLTPTGYADSANPIYFLQSGHGILVGRYLEELLYTVIREGPIISLDRIWGKQELAAVVAPGMLVSTTGAHSFKRLGSWKGSDQPRRVKRKAANVELQFDINAWYATASSAHSRHLSGTSRVTSLVFVRDIRSVNRSLVIEGTCIGICGALDSSPASWNSQQFGGAAFDESEDEDDWPTDSALGENHVVREPPDEDFAFLN